MKKIFITFLIFLLSISSVFAETSINDIDLNNSWDSEIEIIQKEIIWIDWEEMLDIYPQKDFLLWNVFSKISIIFFIILIILITLIFYFNEMFDKLISYILTKLEKKEEKLNKDKIKIKKEINYNNLFNTLEKYYLTDSKDIFYWKTTELFRIFLDDKVRQWLSTKSFK